MDNHSTHTLTSAGSQADGLIAREVALQDAMWGVSNGRADNSKGQMAQAAVAQVTLVHAKDHYLASDPATMIENIRSAIYPRDWSGFRDYGSDVANLVVAAAYLRQEIKRRIAVGEDTTRTDRPRDQPYGRDARPAFTTADPDWKAILEYGRRQPIEDSRD